MRAYRHYRVVAVFGGLLLSCSALAAWQDAQGVALETQTAIPVYTRFVRTSLSGTLSSSVVQRADQTSQTFPGSTSEQGELLYGSSNEVATPLHGVVVVEVPLSALKFGIDKGNYLARARVTATVFNSDGRAVWSQQKESTIRGKEGKLEARRQGSLFFLREVTLPGGSAYTVEGKVEDLQAAGSAGTIQNPLKVGAGAPGLHASDAFFVRKFDGAVDKFEADQVISYEGNALSPMLDPVFPAGRQFGMQMFFVIYPDIQGAPPDMKLELKRGDQVAAQGALPFKTKMRDTAVEGKIADMTPGHAHEFPYLADMKFSQLPAGDYEAVISIRQGRSTITRSVPFTVAGTPPPPVDGAK
jgi:hypothetical protein